MPSIFYGTRLAWICGEPYTKSRRYYEDDLPIDASSNAPVLQGTTTAKQPRPTGNTLLKIIWLVAGIVSIVMPVLVCNARMNEDQNSQWNVVAKQYNKYQQQQQQQNQQEAKKFYDVNNCKWYNFGCQPSYIDENGNAVTEEEMQEEKYRQQQEKQQQYYEQQAEKQQQYYEQQAQNQEQYLQNQAYGQPYWYWGQSEEQRYNAMEQGESSPSLKFVYAWQMIMFLAILAYGYHVLHYLKSLAYLMGALVIWFQFNFLTMFLLSDGSIVTEERIMELSGFYGQFAVLMFMTSAWYGSFGLIFVLGFLIQSHFAPRGETTSTSHTPNADDDKTTDYQAYKETMDAPPSPAKSDISEEYVKVV